MLSRRRLLKSAGTGGIAAVLAGCQYSPRHRWSYRYKLTLTLDTPDGIKSGSSVVEVRYTEAPYPEQGIFTTDLTGEATYVDLGASRRPLIALLTRYLNPRTWRWSANDGPALGLIYEDFDLKADRSKPDHFLAEIAGLRETRAIEPADLPDLVTFADTSDPKSVLLVDRSNLAATLGAGVKWKSVTLEFTDHWSAGQIERSLPWVTTFCTTLDGSTFHTRNALSSSITTSSFIKPTPCERAK